MRAPHLGDAGHAFLEGVSARPQSIAHPAHSCSSSPGQRAFHASHSRVRVAPENKRGWGGEYGRLERLDMDPINHPYNVVVCVS